jgi:hypothetical protein
MASFGEGQRKQTQPPYASALRRTGTPFVPFSTIHLGYVRLRFFGYAVGQVELLVLGDLQHLDQISGMGLGVGIITYYILSRL